MEVLIDQPHSQSHPEENICHRGYGHDDLVMAKISQGNVLVIYNAQAENQREGVEYRNQSQHRGRCCVLLPAQFVLAVISPGYG